MRRIFEPPLPATMNFERDLRDLVLIPAYNEATTLRGLVERALRECPRVVVVDDGSTDGTAATLHGLPVTLLANERNQGKAAALWKGVEHALALGAERVITIDGDGQHRPEDIPRLVQAAARFPGRIVIGARLHDKANFPRRRYYANQFGRFLISWAAGAPIADTQSGFRVYPAELLRRLSRDDVSDYRFVFESEILIAAGDLGVSTVAVPIAGIYSPTGRPSHFRPVADFLRIGRMLTRRLVSRGMYPRGLWRSLNLPATIEVVPDSVLPGSGSATAPERAGSL
jgi:glycosyltransferase involved in cell wall biosynthesis